MCLQSSKIRMFCDLENWIVATVFGATLIKIQFQIFADFGEISGFRKNKRNENFISQLSNFFTSRGAHSKKNVGNFQNIGARD